MVDATGRIGEKPWSQPTAHTPSKPAENTFSFYSNLIFCGE